MASTCRLRSADHEVLQPNSFSSDIALAWPRTGVIDPEGREIATDATPLVIANATAELALMLVRDDLTNDAVQRGRHARSEMIGAVMQKWDSSIKDHLPQHVRAILAPFLTGDYGSARLVAS